MQSAQDTASAGLYQVATPLCLRTGGGRERWSVRGDLPLAHGLEAQRPAGHRVRRDVPRLAARIRHPGARHQPCTEGDSRCVLLAIWTRGGSAEAAILRMSHWVTQSVSGCGASRDEVSCTASLRFICSVWSAGSAVSYFGDSVTCVRIVICKLDHQPCPHVLSTLCTLQVRALSRSLSGCTTWTCSSTSTTRSSACTAPSRT